MSGKAEWAIIAAPAGGIMGVHSLSEAQAIRASDMGTKYREWRFVYEAPALPAKR